MAQEKCFHHGDTSLRAGLQAPASGRVAPSGPPSSDDLLESNLFSSSLHTQADCTVHQNLFYKRSHLRTWPPPTADTSVIIPCQGLGSVLLKPGTTEKPCRSLKIVQASQSKPTPPPAPNSNWISEETDRMALFPQAFCPTLTPYHCPPMGTGSQNLSDSTSDKYSGPFSGVLDLRTAWLQGVLFLHGGILFKYFTIFNDEEITFLLTCFCKLKYWLTARKGSQLPCSIRRLNYSVHLLPHCSHSRLQKCSPESHTMST